MRQTGGLPVAYSIIAICVALFVVTVVQTPQSISGGANNPLHQLLDLYGPLVAAGEVWRLVTSGFMHFGIVHIGFNMFILFQLARILEPRLGSIRFALLYMASLLAGSLGVMIAEPNAATAGASGAVFGLMAAAAIDQWLMGINPLTSNIGRLIGINLVFTFLIPGIAIGAHVGGLIGGAAGGYFLFAGNGKRFGAGAQYALLIFIMVGCFAASLYVADAAFLVDRLP